MRERPGYVRCLVSVAAHVFVIAPLAYLLTEYTVATMVRLFSDSSITAWPHALCATILSSVWCIVVWKKGSLISALMRVVTIGIVSVILVVLVTWYAVITAFATQARGEPLRIGPAYYWTPIVATFMAIVLAILVAYIRVKAKKPEC